MAVDVGEPVVAALETVGEPLVIEAEQVHDRRLQIVHVHLILRDAEPELVGLAPDETGLEPAADLTDAARKVVAAAGNGSNRTKS